MTMLYAGVALSLAVLILSLWRLQRRGPKQPQVLDDDLLVHPRAVGFWMLDPGETVHCQTASGARFSFRIIDRHQGYFELHGPYAGKHGQPWVLVYVSGTSLDGTRYARQFIPGGQIHFVATIEDAGGSHAEDGITEKIERIFRTPFEEKKDAL